MTVRPYIVATRRRAVQRALHTDGTVPVSLWGLDTIALVIGEHRIEGPALTVATHTGRDAAPVIATGEHRAAYCPGLHRGRPALVQQGLSAVPYDRGGERVTGDYTGLNIHSWEGRSDGCITAPGWWVEAALAALDHLAQSGEWLAERHPDGRWCVDVRVVSE